MGSNQRFQRNGLRGCPKLQELEPPKARHELLLQTDCAVASFDSDVSLARPTMSLPNALRRGFFCSLCVSGQFAHIPLTSECIHGTILQSSLRFIQVYLTSPLGRFLLQIELV